MEARSFSLPTNLPVVDPGDRLLERLSEAGSEEQARPLIDQLYRQFHVKVLRICFDRCNHRDRANDLAQEFWLRVCRKWDGLPTSAREFVYWASRVITNIAIDQSRSSQSKQDRSLSIDTPLAASLRSADIDDPAVAVLNGAGNYSDLVMQILSQLPERQRIALELSVQANSSGEDHDWAARQMGIMLSTYTVQLCNARKRFKQLYLGLRCASTIR